MIALLGFIASPVGKVVLIAVALLGAVGYIDRKATYRERAKCNAAAIQSKLDAANADLEAQRRAAVEASTALNELAREKATQEGEHEELKKRISTLPTGQQCIISDRTRGRVR